MIHISDSHDLDQQTSITVNDGMDVGRAAKIALDDLVEKFGYNIEFPIFIEIHPYASFANVEWMYKEAELPEPDIIKNSTHATALVQGACEGPKRLLKYSAAQNSLG